MFAILALIISFIFPSLQILVLTILTILLPMIYQIGHIKSKAVIRKNNQIDYSTVEETIADKNKDIEELEENMSDLVDYIDQDK